jgi:RHS repeat-associated protein
VVTRIDRATNRFINSGSTPTTYDEAGNITTDTKFRGMNFSYDANGRMTFAETTAHANQQTSVYDCAGQRVQTTVNSATRTMVYDIFGQNVADYTGTSGGTLERESIYRGGQLLATYEAGSSALKYVLTDVQGSTRALMNNSGGSSTVIARHDYLPFGEEISSGTGLRTSGQGYGAADTNRWKYGLTERDDTTGLDHTWWRKYENLSGRWTSPDPYNGSMAIANPQSFNKYSYTQNDPVNFVDPSGLESALTCLVDGMPWDCGASFALVGMGFARVANGPGFYGDYLVVAYGFASERGSWSWQVEYRVGGDDGDQSGGEGGGGIHQNPGRTYLRPQDKALKDCLDKAYADYRKAWNAAGLGPGSTALSYLNAYRPHVDDIIPIGLSAIGNLLTSKVIGSIGGFGTMYGPAKRIGRVSIDQYNNRMEVERGLKNARDDCFAKHPRS